MAMLHFAQKSSFNAYYGDINHSQYHSQIKTYHNHLQSTKMDMFRSTKYCIYHTKKIAIYTNNNCCYYETYLRATNKYKSNINNDNIKYI